MNRIVGCFLIVFVLAGCAEKKDPAVPVLPTDDLQGSVHDFMRTYGRLINEGKFDSVPLLYDTLGAIIMGFDRKTFEPLDSIKAKYARRANHRINFKFDSVDVEMLDTSIALVTSIFYLNRPQSSDTLKFYYSGS